MKINKDEVEAVLKDQRAREYISAYTCAENKELLKFYNPLQTKHPSLIENLNKEKNEDPIQGLSRADNIIRELERIISREELAQDLLTQQKSLVKVWDETLPFLIEFYAKIGKVMNLRYMRNQNPQIRIFEQNYRDSVFREAIPSSEEAERVDQASFNSLIIMLQTTRNYLILAQRMGLDSSELQEARRNLPSIEAVRDLLTFKERYNAEKLTRIYTYQD